jgi:CubicO group peptidase (beta-lactamase class C family)
MVRGLLFALPAALLCLGPGAGTAPRAEGEEPAGVAARVDALVARAGVRPNTPGVGVLVMGRDGVRLERVYGLAHLARQTPITTTTTFELASVTKHMTGAAVLLLMQRGKVKVGDDVRKHVPALPAYDARRPITIDHLSRHTSGLPDYFDFDLESAPKKAWYSNADAVAEFARRRESAPLEFAPGERYEYSNSGYMWLAALVEGVSGLSFGGFLSKEFFVPLGMRTAWVHESPRVPTAPTAVGYTWDEERWKPTWSAPTASAHEQQLTVGDGGVWASLHDMAAWVRGLASGAPLAWTTLEAALTPGRTNDGAAISYALGWDLEHDEDGALTGMSHNGSWEGFETWIGHDVARELTVVVLSNRRGFPAEDFGTAVGELFR